MTQALYEIPQGWQESEQESIDLERWPQQEKFVLDTSRYCVWIGGRGTAKTWTGVCKAIDYMATFPGSTLLIIAPTFPQLKATTMRMFFDLVPPEWILYRNLQPDSMFCDVLVNPDEKPCRVYFRSATQPDRIRGMWVAWSWVDEAADCNPELIDVLAPCHRQRGFPYQTVITGTPKGFNWVYKRFIDPTSRIKRKVGKREIISTYFATSMDNPWLPADYVDDLLAQYAGNRLMMEQEVLGRFVAFHGMVFPEISTELHRKMPSGKPWVRVVGGTDFGLSDPSALVLVGEDEAGRFHAFREFYQKHMLGSKFMALHSAWQFENKVKRFYCDPHFPSEIATMRNAGIRTTKGNSDIAASVRLINNMLADGPGGPRLFISPECPNLWTEMLGWSHGGHGESFTDSIPPNQSCHAIDALRYALMGVIGRQHRSTVSDFDIG